MNLDSLSDPEEVPTEWWVERMRIHRDRLLAESDWAMMPDAPTDKTAWAEYRQALRDFPATWEPGPIANFPLAPGEEPDAVESDSESEQSAEVPVEEGPSDDLSDSSSSPNIG